MKTFKNISRGGIGTGSLILAVFLLITIQGAFLFTGSKFPAQPADNHTPGNEVVPLISLTQTPHTSANIQLVTFDYVTITPTPPIQPTNPPAISGCANSQYNTEPWILLGSDPPPGEIAKNGIIRVWVTDERRPHVANNEQIDAATGKVSTRGDTSQTDSGSDGQGRFLWEPTMYVMPAKGTPPSGPFCDARTANCKPYFPDNIKGDYNPDTSVVRGTSGNTGPAIDADWSNFQNGPGVGGAQNYSGGFGGSGGFSNSGGGLDDYTAEFIWDAKTFGLSSGSYFAQFAIHDGDTNLGISCITIRL